MKSTPSFLLVFILLLGSCSKDPAEIYHLPKYVVNFDNEYPGDTIFYEYSDTRMVTSARGTKKVRYDYDTEGRMISVSYIHEGADERPYIRNTWLDSRLIGSAMLRYDNISGEAFELIRIEYQYYGDTLITKYYNDPYQRIKYLEEWQTDPQGNQLSIARFYYPAFGSELVLSWIIESTFDNNPSPFSELQSKTAFDVWGSNNILYFEKRNAEGKVIKAEEYRYVYGKHHRPLVKLSGSDTITKFVY
jgi:hypothetical protein